MRRCWNSAKRSGYVRVRIDGNLYELAENIQLDKNIKHNIEIVVDRLIVKPGIETQTDGFDRKCPEPVGGTSVCRTCGKR